MEDGATALEQHSFGVATGAPTPHRLSAETRHLAARYLSGEIGRTLGPAAFGIDPAFFLRLPTPNQEYAEAVRLIAERAPLRILPEERLAGAATLAEALAHRTPLTAYGSTSHTTLGFGKALAIGLRGFRRQVEERLARGGLDAEGRDLLEAMRVCLDAAGVWHARYVAELERLVAASAGDERRRCEAVLAALRPVPENPPTSFREAVQALWLLWDFQRLCGNWSGLGRLDKLLGPYLRRDLDAGRLTLDEARELLAHFWIKGCEWITAEGRGTGDAQFYQNIVLAGVDEQGREVANEVTDLVLDVVEELHISDFPIAVRLSRRTPEALLRRIAALQRLGGGIVAVYNEERVLANLVRFGYPLEEARDFANDGCWEVLIPGKTHFGYQPFDTLQLLQDTLGLGPGNHQTVEFADFEALYAAFRLRLARRLTDLVSVSTFWRHPTPLLSLFVDDCVERGRAYHAGGPVYTVLSPHAGGLPDTANSLLAIRRLVYEEKSLGLTRFVEILRADWQGHEDLRQRIRNRFEFYGNDSPEADALMQRLFNDFTGLVAQVPERFGTRRPAGISTFGREVSDFRPHRVAAAEGSRRGDILAPNFSPSPGTDRHGPTAVIKSHCSVDFSRLPCGTALDLKILPASVEGEAGIQALVNLLRTFVELGGIFMQVDVVDSELLRDAQAHPDRYPNLSVRVSGWSARFATLSKEWQDMIITRTQQSAR
jgi:formate C-acetyltransferase